MSKFFFLIIIIGSAKQHKTQTFLQKKRTKTERGEPFEAPNSIGTINKTHQPICVDIEYLNYHILHHKIDIILIDFVPCQI